MLSRPSLEFAQLSVYQFHILALVILISVIVIVIVVVAIIVIILIVIVIIIVWSVIILTTISIACRIYVYTLFINSSAFFLFVCIIIRSVRLISFIILTNLLDNCIFNLLALFNTLLIFLFPLLLLLFFGFLLWTSRLVQGSQVDLTNNINLRFKFSRADFKYFFRIFLFLRLLRLIFHFYNLGFLFFSIGS